MVKSPCSPQPALGVAVADEAGNGLLALVEDAVLLARLVAEDDGGANIDEFEFPYVAVALSEVVMLDELNAPERVIAMDAILAVPDFEVLFDVV